MPSTEPIMTIEQLKLWQDTMHNGAKELLQQTHYLVPVFFVLAEQMELDQWLRESILDTMTWKPPENFGTRPTDPMILVIPSDWHDPHTLLNMFAYLSDDPGLAKKEFALLMSLAPPIYRDDPAKVIIKVIKQQFNMHEKDIVAQYIKKVCETTKAHAYIQLCEAWVREGLKSRDDAPACLGDDPLSKEVIMCSMETPTYSRFIREEFMREKSGEDRQAGKVIGFGPKTVSDDTGEQQSGRFVGFLHKQEEAPSAG
jgi:hypothetical protein